MKKVILLILCVFLITGCNSQADLEKEVTNYLDKYVNNDEELISDIHYFDNTLLNVEEETKYKNIMANQYRKMVYEVSYVNNETKNAILSADIEVYDFKACIGNANNYIVSNSGEFTNDNQKTDLLLSYLEDCKDRTTYTINFTFTKENDKWIMKDIDSDDLSKIQGLY